MKRFVQLTIALLISWLALNVPFAFGQSLSYPDEAGYEDLRRTEMETLDTLAQDHYRALAFRLLIAQRRLREAQLMIVKEKYHLVPAVLEAYRETIQEAMKTIQKLPISALNSAVYYQSIESIGIHQQELLRNMAQRVPPELDHSIQSSLSESRKLLVPSVWRPVPGARGSTQSLTGKRSASIQEPLSPQEGVSEASQPITPLGPAATPRGEFFLPGGESRPLAPEENRRLRPGETHPRGTRRPGDTHPRPRAR